MVCDMVFDEREPFNEHLKTHPKVLEEVKPFGCNVCGNAYSHQSDLFLHMKNHQDTTKAFECNICGDAFGQQHDLRVHMKKHKINTRTPFECSVCDHAFSQYTDLQQHFKTNPEHDVKSEPQEIS